MGLSADELALQERLERLKAVLHPQIPRLGEQLPAEGGCWQVREWISGRTYQDLLQARQERQVVLVLVRCCCCCASCCLPWLPCMARTWCMAI